MLLILLIVIQIQASKKFIYVDELDGIRLYNSFAHAVNGGRLMQLRLHARQFNPIEVIVESAAPRLGAGQAALR